MRRPAFLLLSLPCLAAAALPACDAPPATALDGGVDAGPPSALYQRCTSDLQCPGEGAICRRDEDGYPRGYCTVPCDDRTPCDAFGVHHHCLQREGEDRAYCEMRCLNGLDCGRDAYTCTGDLPPSGGICLGICGSDGDCSEGYECERASGVCYPAGTPPPAGADNGAPCADDAACRSEFCVEETTMDGTPTGWVGGACVSYCILPEGWNTNTVYAGTRLPGATCSGDAVCFPQQDYVGGNLGACIDGCESPADCRPGYTCLQSFQAASGMRYSFENGVCLPYDCMRMPCPDGYRCVTVRRVDGSTRNVCSP